VAVKGLCAGEEVVYHGHRLKFWGDRESSRVPLYLDASGPKAMQLVGEIAEGTITPYGISKDAVTQLKDNLGAGSGLAGRDPQVIDCWWIPTTMIAPTKEQALEKVKFYLAMRAMSIMSFPERKGIPEQFHDSIRAFRKEYVATEHSRPDLKTNGALLDKHGLTRWMADRHAILGPPEQVVERIQEIAEWGVTNILISLWDRTLEERRQTARVYAEKVLPHVS
jgi:5,10-methylenetetrahydromethanopterin reductase